ncbi:substrate-binding domain-containing protein [Geminisphaera colitermitum]|uniref:substrate-binding domain-containing protein n=1 Tax=Geminisphaera colitermitum TaxID=1148786 RepID=UPI000300C655|nr:substrate-binding domain-containing protein [Geminisphaera colitermitum]
MTLIPQHSLSSQIADRLKTLIVQNTWSEWLPGERSLSQTLQVSHTTLRIALNQLKHEGVIEARHGIGNRIVAPPAHVAVAAAPGTGVVDAAAIGSLAAASRARPLLSVGLIMPNVVSTLRPFSLWIDTFRDVLFESGWRLKLYEGAHYYRANPASTLEKLVRQNTHTCWVLVLSSAAMQRWFETRGIPCVLAGTCHEGIDLPSVDFDHRAISRHAAGVLLRAGHRHLVLLNPQSRLAGDQQTEMGFFEGIRQSPHAETATASVVYHDIDAASMEKCLVRIFHAQPPHRPTALIITNPYAYLATFTFLTERGLRVPDDVSLISREDDPFFAYLKPAPSRYLNQPEVFARKLATQVLDIPTRRRVGKRHLYLIPKYYAGRSVAAPPQTRTVS